MATGLNKLTAAKVAKATEPGQYGDGGGLRLVVRATGSRAWVLRYMIANRSREMGLGPYPTVSLAQAREAAQAARALLQQGKDPLTEREAAQTAQHAAVMTFGECAADYIAVHRASWSNAKHAEQWTNTLATHAANLAALPVGAVDTDAVMTALVPIWTTKNETATRVRGRVESILDWATVKKYRSGDNPARWRGHLEHLLPAPSRVAPVQHRPALPCADLPAFMAEIRDNPYTSARALEFTILTAARTAEVLGSQRGEFDLARRLWVVPAARMKMRKEHRVPLSPRAAEIIESVWETDHPYLFPGGKTARPLSNMAMLELLRGMRGRGLTVHGFRSTFRDWAAEYTEYPGELAEMALAHAVQDKVEAAYRRGDMFARRVAFMSAWADYCGGGV